MKMLKKLIKKIILKEPLRRIWELFDLIHKYCYLSQYARYRELYDINPSFRFNGGGIAFYGGGEIHCDGNGYIGQYSSIQACDGYEVVIGNNCSISHFVKICTLNSVADQDFSRVGQGARKLRKGNVVIGAYCWVGANVFITEGVKIGENSVIGANSVVTKNIPHCIAAGNPAKVVKFKSYLPESDKLRLIQEYQDSLSDGLKTNYEGLS